jgi:hypothetical protein
MSERADNLKGRQIIKVRIECERFNNSRRTESVKSF